MKRLFISLVVIAFNLVTLTISCSGTTTAKPEPAAPSLNFNWPESSPSFPVKELITPSLTLLSPEATTQATPTTQPQSPPKTAGNYYLIGDYSVLVLHGSYYEMGSQYGTALKSSLNELYPAVVNDYLIKTHNLTMKDIESWVNPRYMLYPDNIKQLLKGMSDATGIEIKKLIILSDLTDLARITSNTSGCSGIAVFGEYTSGGPLIFGRNFDWWGHYKNYNSYLTITVLNPDDGSNSIASIGWAGELLLQTGLNSAGIFLESNDGEISGGSKFLDDVAHPSMQSYSWLANASTLETVREAIKSSQRARAMIIGIADGNSAAAFECSLNEIKPRACDKNGLLVVTNHFTNPSWTNIKPPKDELQTETRYSNLINLAGKYKGSFNVNAMMQVLDTPTEKGGATQPNTIYQVIAVPAELKIWIKAPDYSDWAEIDLKPFMTNAK